MALPDEPGHRRNDDGQAQTKTLGILVGVMVVAGVIALVMTLFGNDNSNTSTAAGQPSGSQVGNQTTTSPSAPASSSTPATTAPAASSTAKATPKPAAPATGAAKATAKPSSRIVRYTVRKGDNLTLIARWFNQRGVSPVYDWNKSIIGRNPNLIYPGQTIIVSLNGDTMNVATTNT